MRFFLGVDRNNWLWDGRFDKVPLFISHITLRRRVTPFPRATTDWALDSGGFSELDRHHRWVTTPQEYVAAVRRYSDQLGRLQWASPQDWMCEPHMLAKTGLTVEEHQRRTVENFLILKDLAPDLPFIPVLQGWDLEDYRRCLDMYAEAGVDLASFPTVGVGSVCRRQSTNEIGEIMGMLRDCGLNLHGFGVKADGLKLYQHHLRSADSMAWSYGGRRVKKPCPEGARNCAHCIHYALAWRNRTLTTGRITP